MGRSHWDKDKLAANQKLVLNEIQKRVKEKYPDILIDGHALYFQGTVEACVYLDIGQWGTGETVYARASYNDDYIRQKKTGEFDYDKLLEQIEGRRNGIVQRAMQVAQQDAKKKEMSEGIVHLGFKHGAIYFGNGSMILMGNGTVKLEMTLNTPAEVEALLKILKGDKDA